MLRIRHRTGPKWHLRASHTLASSVYVLLASLNIFVLKKRYEEARGRTHFRPILPLQPDCVPIQSFYSPSSVPLPPTLTNGVFVNRPCSTLPPLSAAFPRPSPANNMCKTWLQYYQYGLATICVYFSPTMGTA